MSRVNRVFRIPQLIDDTSARLTPWLVLKGGPTGRSGQCSLELSVVEQRYQAVMDGLCYGLTVTEVAERYGVSRQIVGWYLRMTLLEKLGILARATDWLRPSGEGW
jgi:DNA-binding NarL/FixJ family response regulator